MSTSSKIITSAFLLFLIFFLFLLPCALSQEFQEFDEIENPTADDLLTVSNPTIDDFSRLNADEQQQYLLISYNTDFAAQYLVENGYATKSDRIIAEQYFSESPSHINDDPTGFTEYLQNTGVEIVLKGPVADYSDGTISGVNQKINLNSFKKSPAHEDYRLLVANDGNILLQTKAGGRGVQFTGTLHPQSTGSFRLDSGSINGVSIKGGTDLDFSSDGNIDGGTVTSYGTITFSESTVIKTEGKDIVLHDAKIKSIAKGSEGSYRVISGSIIIEDYNTIDGEIRVASGKTLKVNAITLKATSESVVLEIDDQWWFEKYADPIAAAFGEETEGAYVQMITREGQQIVEAQGDLEIGANAQEFVTGVASAPEQSAFLAFTLEEAKNGVAYKKGDSGDTVVMIQELLIAAIDPNTGNPYLSPTYTTSKGDIISSNDGSFGAMTEQALKAWQEDNGIKADGKFGKRSLYIAEESMKGTENLRIITTGKTVLTTDGTNLQVNMRDAAVSVQGHVYSATADQPLLVATTEHSGDVGFPISIAARDSEGDISTGISAAYRDCAVGTDESGQYICEVIVEGQETLGATEVLGQTLVLEATLAECQNDGSLRDTASCTLLTNNKGALNVVQDVVGTPPSAPEQAFSFPSAEGILSTQEETRARNLYQLGLSEPESIVAVVYSSADARVKEYGLAEDKVDEIADLTLAIGMVETYMGESNEAGQRKLFREDQMAQLEETTGIIPDTVSLGPMQLQIAHAKENAKSLGQEFSANELVTFEGGIKYGQQYATKLWVEYADDGGTYEEQVALVATAYNIGDDAPKIAAIQQQLIDLGHDIEVTGWEDPAYEAALADYRKTKGIEGSSDVVQSEIRAAWQTQFGRQAPTAIPVQTEYVQRVLKYCAKTSGRCTSPLTS